MALTKRGMLFYVVTEGLKALVVGSGRVGRRKIFKLIDGGAEVTVVTKEQKHHMDGKVRIIVGDGLDFATKNLDYFDIVVAATDDPVVNSKISELARQKKKLVNSVTSPEDCSLIFPAVIDYGRFQLGVTTGGRDPSLSKKIKKIIRKALRDSNL